MPRYIVKLHDHYFEWSTIVDAPVTFGMTLDEFTEYYEAEYGHDGMRDLPERLARVEEYGTSGLCGQTPNDLISGYNRAGPDECYLTLNEVYLAYCLHQPILNGWLVPERDE